MCWNKFPIFRGGGHGGTPNTATPQKKQTNTASPQENLTKHRHRNIYIYFFVMIQMSTRDLRQSFWGLMLILKQFFAQRNHHKAVAVLVVQVNLCWSLSFRHC